MLPDHHHVAREENALLGQPYPAGCRRVTFQMNKVDLTPPLLEDKLPGKCDLRFSDFDLVELSGNLRLLFAFEPNSENVKSVIKPKAGAR